MTLATRGISLTERVAYATARDVLLLGATGQAQMLAPILRQRGARIAVVYDRNPDVVWPGQDVLRSREAIVSWLGEYWGDRLGAVVAIANPHGRDRLDLMGWLEQQGVPPVTLIADEALIEDDADVGAGCQILPRAIVGVGARLGRGVILSHLANVEHGCILHDGAQVGPSATLCGDVTLGTCAFVGAGAIVLPRVTIGRDVIVGAGAVVTKDIPDGVTVVGMPAHLHVKECAR